MSRGPPHPARLRDRADAGARLADRLERYRELGPVVLALPRGGVPVGYEIARRLGAPLDVLIVRKIGAPSNPEYGLGALVEDGLRYVDEPRMREAGYSMRDLEPTIARELEEVRRRATAYRRGAAALDVQDRVVILVDDGVATGATLRTAIRSVRTRRPRRIIVALGVAPRDTIHQLGREADDVVALLVPELFYAVGEWYDRFDQVGDREVETLLEKARGRAAPPA